jgi:hypothetical protein
MNQLSFFDKIQEPDTIRIPIEKVGNIECYVVWWPNREGLTIACSCLETWFINMDLLAKDKSYTDFKTALKNDAELAKAYLGIKGV